MSVVGEDDDNNNRKKPMRSSGFKYYGSDQFDVEEEEGDVQEDQLSPEDLAWVDSCIVKDAEFSTPDLNSLTHSLLDILTLRPEQPSTGSSSSSLYLTNPRLQQSSTPAPVVVVGDLDNNERMGSGSDALPVTGNVAGDAPPSGVTTGAAAAAFLPHYREDDESVFRTLDSLSFSTADESTEEIFKVWDLGIQDGEDDEDELVKQLNKALSETCPGEELESLKEMKEVSVDNLVCGIADLSLDQGSF